MMAAGGQLEAFWQLYPFHKKDHIFDILDKFRIGELHPDDRLDPNNLPDFSDVH